DQVIENAAGLVQQAAVERLAGGLELADVVGEQVLQEGAHALTPKVDDAHVRDVKDARGAAHGVVFADLGAVLHRHVPAAEIDQARPEFPVQRVERSLSSQGSLRISHDKMRRALSLTDQAPAALLSCDLRDQARKRRSPSVGGPLHLSVPPLSRSPAVVSTAVCRSWA